MPGRYGMIALLARRLLILTVSSPYEYKSKAPDGTFDPLDFYFNTLYKPSVKPTSSSYKPSDAFAWPQSNDVYWKDNLKKRFCIIDLDNRPLNGRHQIFGQDILSWEHGREVHGLSAGILNHWIYSMCSIQSHISNVVVLPLTHHFRQNSWLQVLLCSN